MLVDHSVGLHAAAEVAAAARDIITDFMRGEDDINLRRLDANEDRHRNQNFEFIGTQRFHKDAGQLHYQVRNGNAIVSGDTDGDGRADFSFVVDDVTRLRASAKSCTVRSCMSPEGWC